MHSPSSADAANVPPSAPPVKGDRLDQALGPAAAVDGANSERDYAVQLQQSLETNSAQLVRIGSNRYQATYSQLTSTRSAFQRKDSLEDSHSLDVKEFPLRGVKCAGTHEKYPSWPTAANKDGDNAASAQASHRSKSWTDRMCYPKEQLIFVRPLLKKMAHPQPHQLKPVSESSDKTSSSKCGVRVCSSKEQPRRSRDGKERNNSSFPSEREYVLYHRSFSPPNELKKLTQSELEDYMRKYEEPLTVQHQKQSSYAHSEGYHSYVSSTDSTSTPFLDRLRKEGDVTISRTSTVWESRDRDSVVTATSETASTSETLKWRGSLSDLSVVSTSFNSTAKQQQLIAHSAKVKTPQRHGSESILYIDSGKLEQIEHRAPPSCQQHLKLFPISTYSVPETDNRTKPSTFAPLQMSVAERVSELEKQNIKTRQENNKSASDLSLKAKQKKSVLSFYERQKKQEETKQPWRSEPHLITDQMQVASSNKPQNSSRRASTASEYADWKDCGNQIPKTLPKEAKKPVEHVNKHGPTYVPDSARFSPNSILDGPVIVGSAISVDDWVPERPPKNSKLLRNAFPDLYAKDERLPSPDLPLPSPPTVIEDEVVNNDVPFPPLPAEIVKDLKQNEENFDKTYKETKSKYPTNASIAERIVRPTPIRTSGVKHEVYLENADTSATAAINKDGHQSTAKQTEVPSTNAAVLPMSQKIYSRSVSSNFKSDKLFRNSFRVSQGTSTLSTNVDVRASMRHFRNTPNYADKFTTSQKQAVQAVPTQKVLSRSTTVEEMRPKRPVNPFSRSTSVYSNKPETTCIPSFLTTQTDNQKKELNMSHQNAIFNRVQSPQASQSKETNNGADSRNYECDKLVSKATLLISCTETRIDVIANLGPNTNNINSLNKSYGSQEVKSNIIVKKPALPVVPPPLYPKQSNLKKSQEIPAAPSLLTSSNRAQETSSYTPSRATLPDSGIGSYKLIQRDGTLAYSARPAEAAPASVELGQSAATSQPTIQIEQKHENTVPSPEADDKINADQSNSAISPVDNPKGAIIENTGNDRIRKKESKSLDVGSAKLKTEAHTDIIVKKVENKNALRPPVAVSVKETLQQENSIPKNSLVEFMKELGRFCWTQHSLELEWQRIRRLLLVTMPEDHHLLKHSLIKQELKNPSDFIRDYFNSEIINSSNTVSNKGEAGKCGTDGGGAGTASVGRGGGGATGSAPLAGATPTLIDLKMDAVRCCEKLVEVLKKEIESTTAEASKNDSIGSSIHERLSSKLAWRFAVNNTEVHHISALMAGLSTRLARTHDEIASESDPKILKDLNTKRSKLEEQMAEARSLKADIYKRGRDLDAALATAFNDTERLHETRVFITNKALFNIRAKHLSHRLDTARDTLRLLQKYFTTNEDADR